MASLTRCPSCDTFVKPEGVDKGACPFCPAATAASQRNPIPGLVLAVAAALPGCSGGNDSGSTPVYGVAAADARPADAMPADDAMPVEGDATPVADAMRKAAAHEQE